MLAGVSKSTVSRVLNNADSVRASTRRQVEEAMLRLGYRPNVSARRLAGSTDRRIGLILPFFTEMFSSFYVHEVLLGVGEIVSERDAELLLHIEHRSPDKDALEKKLFGNGQLGGWLIADESISHELLKQLQAKGTPFVLLNRSVGLRGASAAVVDNGVGASLAAEHLMDMGHRRIAILAGDLALQPAADRASGFASALGSRGLTVEDDLCVQCNFNREMAYDAARRMLTGKARPTAIFAASDLMASGVYEAAAAEDVSIPEELSVVGFDDDVLAGQLVPKLTTVRQPLREMAQTAAAWLLDYIEGKTREIARISLAPRLIERESTAPPR